VVTESQQTDPELGISVTEMRAQADQATIRRVRFSDAQPPGEAGGVGSAPTQFIVRETDEETENEEVVDEKETKKKKAEEDKLYFFGYFSWYWGKHGFFKATREFFGMQIFNGCVFSLFNSVGAAIGAFFFRKWFLKGSFLGSYC
jgi:hypothetical protein